MDGEEMKEKHIFTRKLLADNLSSYFIFSANA
jgi:hypothetical protein